MALLSISWDKQENVKRAAKEIITLKQTAATN